ncbi:MAG: hypothetical protein K2X11_04950 [Acetobacteraceae bacterium]|nr:hypothetical protein [Acetobacteraceae bacterium]
MIQRRHLPLLAGALLPGTGRAQTAGASFAVIRNGDMQVGTHTLRVTAQGGTKTVESDFSAAPRLMGIVVYRYEHRYTEVTEGGRFRSVTSRLNRNGRIVEVSGEAVPGAVVVRGPQGEVRLAADAAPLSWWEPQRFGRVPVFGTTTGQLLRVTFERAQEAGGVIHWRCRGEIEADLRYDAAGNWIGFDTIGDDGSRITYRRT